MNFISHFFLDLECKDTFFFLGVSTPDLIGNFDRSIRLKQSTLPLIMENDASKNQINFYNGVIRHFEVDRLFHSSHFFKRETQYLNGELKQIFTGECIDRTFFVSHIMLELILDRVLIRRHNDLPYYFYSHFEAAKLSEIVNLTEWITQRSLPGYDHFLQKFSEKQFLYRYVDMRYLAGVMRYILNKVGIRCYAYVNKPEFLDLMYAYENRLEKLYVPALQELSYALHRMH